MFSFNSGNKHSSTPPIPPRPKHVLANAEPAIPPAAESSNHVSSGKPSAKTLRHCELMKVYFLDHYFDLLDYIDKRKKRLGEIKSELSSSSITDAQRVQNWKAYCGKERALLRKRRTRTRITHFDIIRQIGQGGYGQVYLCRKKDTSEICALKKMGKKLIQRLGETQHILTERDVLTQANSPWLVKLLYAFQDMENIYLAMEYVPGGDLRTLLNKSGILIEPHARFYFAEMAASVFELHRLGYIHRDLKPENFLIDSTGHIKLTDFGLSRGSLSQEMMEFLREKLERAKKSLPPALHKTASQRYNTYKSVRGSGVRAFSLVGSPDYMAPEVLVHHDRGYDFAVDYWSLGCILFECLSGYPPFTAPTSDEIWVNVYHWKRVLDRPIYTGVDEEFNLSDISWDLITKLIAGYGDRLKTPKAVFDHPFMASVNVKDLRSATGLIPPFAPKLGSTTDTSYFDDFSNPADMSLYKEVNDRQDKLQDIANDDSLDNDKSMLELKTAFVGFTFRHNQSKAHSPFETLV